MFKFMGTLISFSKMNFLKPDYNGGSISNIYGSILKNFDLNSDRKPLRKSFEKTQKFVLVIFDAFGEKTLERGIEKGFIDKRLLENFEHETITSIFPSTTACAMLSFYTGLTPGEHGVMGFTTYVKELGTIVNMLNLSHPSQEVPLPLIHQNFTKYISEKAVPIGDMLAEKGIKGYSVIPASIYDTPTNQFYHRGLERVKYYYPWDAFQATRKILQENENVFLDLYIPTVDTLSHHYGPFSPETLSSASDLLKLLLNSLEGIKGLTLLLTADHGQTDNTVSHVADDSLMELLEMPPWGDSRAAFMKVKDEEKVRKHFEENLKGFKLFTREEYLKEGFLGEYVDPRFQDRLGDILAVPEVPESLIYSYRGPEGDKDYIAFKGHHGGLTEEEQLVPLLIYRS